MTSYLIAESEKQYDDTFIENEDEAALDILREVIMEHLYGFKFSILLQAFEIFDTENPLVEVFNLIKLAVTYNYHSAEKKISSIKHKVFFIFL